MRMPSARLLLATSLLTSLSLFVAACSSKPSPESPPAPPPRQDAAYGQPAGYPQSPAASAAPAATGAYPDQLRSEGLSADAWVNLPPPADVPAGLAQIDAAERALAIVLGAPARKDDAQPTTPTAKRPEPAAPPALSLPPDQACSIACSALASMKRSADHVCTMAGDKDAVCGTARERVQRAEARVTAACPACSK